MCMAYAPSGEHLAVGYAGGHVKLFNPASLALIHNLFPAPLVVRGQADLFSMAYAPNGKKNLGLGYYGGYVELLNTSSLTMVQCCATPHPSSTLCVAYAPSGDHLAVGYSDGRVEIRQADSLALVDIVMCYPEHSPCCIAYPPTTPSRCF